MPSNPYSAIGSIGAERGTMRPRAKRHALETVAQRKARQARLADSADAATRFADLMQARGDYTGPTYNPERKA